MEMVPSLRTDILAGSELMKEWFDIVAAVAQTATRPVAYVGTLHSEQARSALATLVAVDLGATLMVIAQHVLQVIPDDLELRGPIRGMFIITFLLLLYAMSGSSVAGALGITLVIIASEAVYFIGAIGVGMLARENPVLFASATVVGLILGSLILRDLGVASGASYVLSLIVGGVSAVAFAQFFQALVTEATGVVLWRPTLLLVAAMGAFGGLVGLGTPPSSPFPVQGAILVGGTLVGALSNASRLR